ncbi:MAG TPA: MFS transporter [Candidatus Dormibacteraeota bacterium]|nr:MFS transporter [Candidatus Dormibacteraeota bacterium]
MTDQPTSQPSAAGSARVAAPVLGWRQLVGEGRGRLTIGILLVEFVAAVQSSVVASIMPAVAHDLGGIQFYGLVFSGYFLASIAATPAAGQAADRQGPARPFTLMIGIFALGTLAAGFAPSMPVLAAARLVQGWGGGAQYTIAYGAIAKAYPEAGRARILALLSAMWIIPGLLGPGFGSVVASTVGWRWAFFALLPLMAVAMFMVVPSLATIPGTASPGPTLRLRWPLLLAGGTGLFVTGLAVSSWLAIPVAAAGLAILVPSAVRVMPPGTFRARPGLGSTVLVGLLTNFGFFTGFVFLPLLVTRVAGRSLFEGGAAVTIVNLTWSLGAWWQTRAIERWNKSSLVRWSSLLLGLGLAGTAAPVVGLPVIVSYAAWGLAGAAMGVAFNTLYLVAAETAPKGFETGAIASLQNTNRLGIALGTGLGGAAVATAHYAGAPVAAGLAGAFGLAAAVTLFSALLAGRLYAGDPPPG